MNQHSMERLIDFNLEILNGCKWNCTGCNIAKTDQDGFTDGDFDKLTYLFDDMAANGYILSNIAITPTDFMTAANAESIFQPTLRPMLQKFCAITLNTTFLESRDVITKWANILAPILDGMTLKISIPIEPKHYTNEKYVNTILEKRDYFIGLIPNVKYTKSYFVGNLYDYNDFKDPFADFELFSEEFHHQWRGNHLDLVITEGRLPMSNEANRQRLKSILEHQNRLYNTSVNDDTKSLINFTYGKRHEGFDRDYVYKNGRIYAPAFVGEPLIIFDDAYSISNDINWDYNALLQLENTMMNTAFQHLEHTTECKQCEFITACLGRGLINVMHTLETTDCLAPRRAFIKMRQ